MIVKIIGILVLYLIIGSIITGFEDRNRCSQLGPDPNGWCVVILWPVFLIIEIVTYMLSPIYWALYDFGRWVGRKISKE